MKGQLSTTGYWIVDLRPVIGKPRGIHRLLAEAFIPNPLNLPQINHIDGNKINNALSNLEWVTAKQNMQHGFKIGIYKRGEARHTSKLTEEQVKTIRSRIEKGDMQKKIAEDFGVGQSAITAIKQKKTWTHI